MSCTPKGTRIIAPPKLAASRCSYQSAAICNAASVAVGSLAGKLDIEHHSQADDLRAGFEIPKWGAFCHAEMPGVRPANLTTVSSDRPNKRL